MILLTQESAKVAKKKAMAAKGADNTSAQEDKVERIAEEIKYVILLIIIHPYLEELTIACNVKVSVCMKLYACTSCLMLAILCTLAMRWDIRCSNQ